MIYFCADDYGLCDSSSIHIKECVDEGVLNKVSVFPNFNKIDLSELPNKTNISLHLNLVEGKCLSDVNKLKLIIDDNGNFKNTFGKLFILNLFKSKKLEVEIYEEIKAQVMFWKKTLPKDAKFLIDSHQHTHMIPVVFKVLLRVLDDENINLHYLRIPAEPIYPYIKIPSLYFTYNSINIIKQWLLKFLWLCNKKHCKNRKIPTAYFFGILFSGKMDKQRVAKILPKYIQLAKKHNKDIEVLFHPGFIEEKNFGINKSNVVFDKFYLSKNRKIEFDAAKQILKEEV